MKIFYLPCNNRIMKLNCKFRVIVSTMLLFMFFYVEMLVCFYIHALDHLIRCLLLCVLMGNIFVSEAMFVSKSSIKFQNFPR